MHKWLIYLNFRASIYVKHGTRVPGTAYKAKRLTLSFTHCLIACFVLKLGLPGSGIPADLAQDSGSIVH